MLSFGVPSRLFDTGPQRSLPCSTVWPNMTERKAPVRSYFGQTKALRSAMTLRSAKQDRTEALCSVLFGRTVPEGRKMLGAGEGRCRRAEGAPGESNCRGAGRSAGRARAGEWRKGAGEGRGDGRDEGSARKGKRGGAGEETGPKGHCWGGEKTGVASEEGEETGVASEGREEMGAKGGCGEKRGRVV